jgi:hypothetical protein
VSHTSYFDLAAQLEAFVPEGPGRALLAALAEEYRDWSAPELVDEYGTDLTEHDETHVVRWRDHGVLMLRIDLLGGKIPPRAMWRTADEVARTIGQFGELLDGLEFIRKLTFYDAYVEKVDGQFRGARTIMALTREEPRIAVNPELARLLSAFHWVASANPLAPIEVRTAEGELAAYVMPFRSDSLADHALLWDPR